MARMSTEQLRDCFDARDAAVVAAAALAGAPDAQRLTQRGSRAELTSLVERGHQARSAVMEHNLGLVGYVARQLRIPGEREDQLSHGVIGLAQAFDRFDPQRGTAWSTYAYTYVRGNILNGFYQEQGWRQNLTKQAALEQNRYRKLENQIASRVRPEDLTDAVAQASGATRNRVAELLETPLTLSLDQLEAGRATLAHDAAAKHEQINLKPFLAALPPAERTVVSGYFGVGGVARRIDELSRELRVSPATTRRTLASGCEHLRELIERFDTDLASLPRAGAPTPAKVPGPAPKAVDRPVPSR